MYKHIFIIDGSMHRVMMDVDLSSLEAMGEFTVFRAHEMIRI